MKVPCLLFILFCRRGDLTVRDESGLCLCVGRALVSCLELGPYRQYSHEHLHLIILEMLRGGGRNCFVDRHEKVHRLTGATHRDFFQFFRQLSSPEKDARDILFFFFIYKNEDGKHKLIQHSSFFHQQTNLGAKWRARTTSSSSFAIRIHG